MSACNMNRPAACDVTRERIEGGSLAADLACRARGGSARTGQPMARLQRDRTGLARLQYRRFRRRLSHHRHHASRRARRGDRYLPRLSGVQPARLPPPGRGGGIAMTIQPETAAQRVTLVLPPYRQEAHRPPSVDHLLGALAVVSNRHYLSIANTGSDD